MVDSNKKKVDIKNFLLTGKNGTGKSRILTKLQDSHQIAYSGFKTIPYFEYDGRVGGYLFQSLVPVEGLENNQKISKVEKGYVEAFRGLGVQCLKLSQSCDIPVVIMDELGRFEQHEKPFIYEVNQILDGPKFVIAVVKKEVIPYLEDIKNREDCKVLDLDVVSFDSAYDFIQEELVKFLDKMKTV